MTSEAQKNVMVVAIVVGAVLFIGAAFLVMNAVNTEQAAADAYKNAVVAPEIPAYEFKDVSYGSTKYGWGEVKGVIVSNVPKAHSVAVYVDFYNKDDVKIDHVLDYVNVDGNGQATFKCTTTKDGDYKAKWYIDHYY